MMVDPTSDNTHIQVLTALTKRGRLDKYQIASEASLPLTQVQDALEALTQRGLLKHSGDTELERFEVDSKALARDLQTRVKDPVSSR